MSSHITAKHQSPPRRDFAIDCGVCGRQCVICPRKKCKDLDSRLQPSIWKYNVKSQNSNLLHLATKDDNVGLAEALLQQIG